MFVAFTVQQLGAVTALQRNSELFWGRGGVSNLWGWLISSTPASQSARVIGQFPPRRIDRDGRGHSNNRAVCHKPLPYLQNHIKKNKLPWSRCETANKGSEWCFEHFSVIDEAILLIARVLHLRAKIRLRRKGPNASWYTAKISGSTALDI